MASVSCNNILMICRSSIQVVLEGLWTNYLHNVTTSVMDYISVNHLGMLLKELHKLCEWLKN